MRFSSLSTLATALVMGSLLLSAGIHAETTAFKCTAANGDVSYLDTKPTTGCVTIEVVRVNVGKGTGGDDNATPSADGKKTEEQENQELAARKDKIKKDCEGQRKNLEILKTKTYVQEKDEDGKTHALTPEEQQQRIKETQAHIDNFCS
jgi:hypothetical protein